MNVVEPHGYAPPTTYTRLSDIKNELVNGVVLTTTAYCFDRYLASSTDYYWKSSTNFWLRPIPCAKAQTVTIKVRVIHKRNTTNSNYSVNCNARLCYFNDNSTKIEVVDDNSIARLSIDSYDTSSHDNTGTLTMALNSSLKTTYKWVAVCFRVSTSVNDYSGSIQVALFSGTGITDAYYTT